jgi:hypothetical protein
MDYGLREGGGEWENMEHIQVSGDTLGKENGTCMPKMSEISKAPIGGWEPDALQVMAAFGNDS